MPHDRLFSDGEKFSTQSMIQIDNQDGVETLKEFQEPITDPLVKDFLKHLESMPQEDHITAHSKMQISGMIKRMKDMWDDYRYKDQM